MQQVVQNVRSGETTVIELPDPSVGRHEVLVAAAASVISAGTEKYVVTLAGRSLLGKARARPDHVRRVIEKVRQEGLRSTLQQVQGKLSEPMSLGYSASGVVIECGDEVHDFKPGDRVATAAPHAGIAAVSRNLCAKLPDAVSFESGAYSSIAAIALQGVRLSRATLGERVLVIGLGLVGQLAACLLKAQGCRVFGTDIDPERVSLATALGCDAAAVGQPTEAVEAFSAGRGVDAVLIAAATSSNDPIEFAAAVCRPKARIVLIGVSGLELPRAPFYAKELEFTVSSSLGAGRGDPLYEERGIDYPFAHARWTAQRNMEAVGLLMADGRLPVERLTTHRYDINDAAKAYEHVMKPSELTLGVVLRYPEVAAAGPRRLETPNIARSSNSCGVSVIGAGNYARLVLLPTASKNAEFLPRGICSAGGLTATQASKDHGFAFVCSDVEEVFKDTKTNAVMIATRHDLHADLAIRALRAGKHVFLEKPLAIREEDVDAISRTLEELGPEAPILMVGFNRRFSSGLLRVARHFDGVSPRTVTHRFIAGPVPTSSWVQDPDQGGGRIVGEACHAIDACIRLTGSLPVRVFAESVRTDDAREISDDQVCITLRHQDGSVSSITYHAAADSAGPRERLEVFGGGRSAILDGWADGELWRGHRRVKFSGGRDKGHAAELQAFFAAVNKGGEWPISWPELAAGARASFAARESLRTGMPVDLA